MYQRLKLNHNEPVSNFASNFNLRPYTKEALCGMKMTVKHLDKRELLISTNEGDVIKPNSFKAVYDEGMPTYGRPFEKVGRCSFTLS